MAAGGVARGAGRHKSEWAARVLIVLLIAAVVVGLVAWRPGQAPSTVIRASMPEKQGWMPSHLTVAAGEPLHLELTADDVVHGFGVARPDGGNLIEPVTVEPGKMTAVTLTFEEPGIYTFYCTRWCGSNHWRMRGTIEVKNESGERTLREAAPPLYMRLGLDIDAPHPPEVTPERRPAAERGALLDAPVLLEGDAYRALSPAQAWRTLRAQPQTAALDDASLWDLVAFYWQQQSSPEAVALGAALYAENCAACHGESGAGDGVFATEGAHVEMGAAGEAAMAGLQAPTDFTDPAMLGASNALLEGKIIRGGMGTGMPYWGSIFTPEEVDAILAYLWTFQYE